MTPEELKVHGSIFLLLKKFVENNYSADTWIKLTETAGTPPSSYDIHKNYPARELFALISTAAYHMGFSENDLKEKFGEYLVPDLLCMYKSHIPPSWKTFEMLLYTEQVMHKAVRNEASGANPPVLHISKVNDNTLIIDYYSKRKLASLAIGIIRGIAKFYKESERVQIIPKSNPDDERVQIRVEFK